MRLIDADALKEKFKDREGDDFTVFHFYDAIDNAPTVNPCEWISVSERLPDVSQRYLVYTKYDEVMTDFFMGDEFMQGDDVIAWMPLPEKYNSEVKEG